MSALPYIFAFTSIILTSIFLRLLYILPALNPTKPSPRAKGQPTRLLIVLGSGGHTAEMLSLLHTLDPNLYTHRSYVVSSGDDFSALKAIEFENALATEHGGSKREIDLLSTYDVSVIPRAREIYQPLLTTPWSSLRCLFACFAILRTPATQQTSIITNAQRDDTRNGILMCKYSYPDLIVANGPATAVLIIVASLIFRFFGLSGTNGKMRTVYVESWARVSTLSLSGKILRAGGMVNRMLVQWDMLAKNGQGEFRGALVR
ncbi:MAG: hypothetical protein LQ346_004557 [Caloplaca aetnensis]|nr:MAG: hypothetical protein LQ346_004557 [Caloplaca aetnensis]